MGELSSGTTSADKPPADRLDSWKEIAAYLSRDITTVQRWEKREGMPVHRHLHDKLGSVYASKAELDDWVRSRRARLEAEERSDDVSSPKPAELEPPSVPARRVRRWWVLGVVAFLALLTFGYVLIPLRPKDASHRKINSLAVLPLKNLSGDPTQEYLSEGMTEALIGSLSTIHDLRVISRTSVMRFKDTQLSLPEIAKTLHVDAIVEGSVIREGSRIRIHAQLIRAATDEHIWSESYDRDMRDVLDLQSEVTQAIARKVKGTVSGEEYARLTARHSVSPEVYESYLQGWFALNRSVKKTDIQQGIDHFEDAIKKDPTFAPAYLGVAQGYDELGSNFIGDPPDVPLQKEMSAARKALELDSTLSDAHDIMADLLRRQWQWAQAEAEYRRALELNPNDAGAYVGLAQWLLSMGRSEEALDWARRGRELDPLEVRGTDIAMILSGARRYDEAIRELRVLLADQPDEPEALWDLGIVLVKTISRTMQSPFLRRQSLFPTGVPALSVCLSRRMLAPDGAVMRFGSWPN